MVVYEKSESFFLVQSGFFVQKSTKKTFSQTTIIKTINEPVRMGKSFVSVFVVLKPAQIGQSWVKSSPSDNSKIAAGDHAVGFAWNIKGRRTLCLCEMTVYFGWRWFPKPTQSTLWETHWGFACTKQWRIQGGITWSISCSFRGEFNKFLSEHPHLRVGAPPPLGKFWIRHCKKMFTKDLMASDNAWR